MRPAGILLALVLAAGGCGGGESGPAARGPATPLDHETTGTITGSVRVDGPVPPPVTLGGTPECVAEHAGPMVAADMLVHDGRLANAFVYVKDGLGNRVFDVPTDPVVIDQRGCTYEPRVVGVRVGQPIKFVNSDPFLHNVHGMPTTSSAWNFGMSVKGSTRTIHLDRPEVMVSVRCDVHPWMQGWIGVLDHPYFAVTGADGQFVLRDVPPGDYTVAAWHERLGTRESRVTLAPRASGEVTFAYAAP